jgi:homoserine O-succinyltransferase
MPIRVPNNLPALEALHAEAVDIIPQQQAVSQDIRPLRLLLLNLMPKKRDTEIQFARLFGNSPLQVEMIFDDNGKLYAAQYGTGLFTTVLPPA